MDHFLLPFLLFLLCSVARAVNGQYNQNYQQTTPVPILKQIDRHNEDGSYSYGYEAADGSFKIESKYPSGEVYGKYGFVDDTGKVREVEYGASQRGFEPAGTDINVPPSTVQGNGVANPNDPEDDGQYREDPSIYHTDPKYTNGEYYRPIAKRPSNQIRPNAAPATAYDLSALPVPMRSQYQPTYQQEYQPQYQPQQYQQEYRYEDRAQYQQPLRRPSNPHYYQTPDSQPQIQRDYVNNYGQ